MVAHRPARSCRRVFPFLWITTTFRLWVRKLSAKKRSRTCEETVALFQGTCEETVALSRRNGRAPCPLSLVVTGRMSSPMYTPVLVRTSSLACSRGITPVEIYSFNSLYSSNARKKSCHFVTCYSTIKVDKSRCPGKRATARQG